MEYFHSSPEFGHFGRFKTIDSIKRRFYWYKMNSEIASFVKKCQTCQKFKGENMKRMGLMGKIPVADSVFETVYLDFIGPFILSKYRRNRFLLVLVDQLSGWVELCPMPNGTAKRVVDFLEEVMCHFGAPKAIVTDNGSNFVGKTMKKLCKDWSIKHVLTAAYNPSANRCERSNKDIVRMIASFVEGKHDLWDMHLKYFALALRSAVNETTGVSPALLQLGRNIRLPIDNSLNPEISRDYEQDRNEIAQKAPEFVKSLVEEIRKRISHVQDVNKFYQDQKHRSFEFNVGDLVMVRNNQLSDAAAGICKKLSEKWIGPFKIIRKTQDLSYILDMPKRMVNKRRVSDLRPYHALEERPEKPGVVLRKTVSGIVPEVVNERSRREQPKVNYRTSRTYNRKN
jgi:hypothetical protein